MFKSVLLAVSSSVYTGGLPRTANTVSETSTMHEREWAPYLNATKVSEFFSLPALAVTVQTALLCLSWIEAVGDHP